MADWEFGIEWVADEDPAWCATLPIDAGDLVIGYGATPWRAVADCIRNVEPTRVATSMVRRVLDQLQAGELVCRVCGTTIEPASPSNPIASFVLCRRCNEAELATL